MPRRPLPTPCGVRQVNPHLFGGLLASTALRRSTSGNQCSPARSIMVALSRTCSGRIGPWSELPWVTASLEASTHILVGATAALGQHALAALGDQGARSVAGAEVGNLPALLPSHHHGPARLEPQRRLRLRPPDRGGVRGGPEGQAAAVAGDGGERLTDVVAGRG
jgi:hypothetical protein